MGPRALGLRCCLAERQARNPVQTVTRIYRARTADSGKLSQRSGSPLRQSQGSSCAQLEVRSRWQGGGSDVLPLSAEPSPNGPHHRTSQDQWHSRTRTGKVPKLNKTEPRPYHEVPPKTRACRTFETVTSCASSHDAAPPSSPRAPLPPNVRAPSSLPSTGERCGASARRSTVPPPRHSTHARSSPR